MESTLSDILQVTVIIAFLAGATWMIAQAYGYYGPHERPARFTRMMQRLGMRVTAAGEGQIGLYLPNAIRLCHHCDKKVECDAWLAQNGQATMAPPFCANANLPHLVAALPWNRAD